MKKIEDILERYYNLVHVYSLLDWDYSTYLSKNGGADRGDAISEIEKLMNETLSHPRMNDWLKELDEKAKRSDDTFFQADTREISRLVKNMTILPGQFVAEKTKIYYKSLEKWKIYRKEDNWKDYLPYFEKVINVTKEEGQIRSDNEDLNAYEALMDLYEPGSKVEKNDALFDEIKDDLRLLRENIQENNRNKKILEHPVSISLENQKKFNKFIIESLGFDFNAGRVDTSHHPFCGGVPTDIRITNRYDINNFSESLMGIIHETGHARYEQCLPKRWAKRPIGAARSFGIHEGQSLLFEMQIGRSEEFIHFMSKKALEFFDDNSKSLSSYLEFNNLKKLYRKVEPGLIRVMADEVTYPMHIILRYELEKELILNDLNAKDLPEAFNSLMKKYLGIEAGNAHGNGVMQDIHWPSGSFGYFASYCLGAMNAAQIFQAMKEKNSNLMTEISMGDFKFVNKFLEEAVWANGSFYETDDLMKNVTGKELNSKIYLDHLERRYNC